MGRQRLQGLSARQPQQPSPLRRLALVKQAMHETTEALGERQRVQAEATEEDRLGWTLRFIRAAERINLLGMSKAVQNYPHLASLADVRSPLLRECGGLGRFRAHAVDLARNVVLADLREAHANADGQSEQALRQRREQLGVRLRRLRPGGTTALSALVAPDGEVVTDSAEMAALLRSHWGEVFAATPINASTLERWIAEDLPPEARSTLPPADDPRWRVRRQDVGRAMKLAGASAPGPDGIPYSAWQRLGETAVDILHAAGLALETCDFHAKLMDMEPDHTVLQHSFNLGILACIPKGSGDDPPDASATRPLSIVNTDNRILASSRRIRWEPILEEWVSGDQRGFLRGRSMISNVVEMELEAMRLSLSQPAAALLLFDFRAAFPSMSQAFLFRILDALGLPPHVMNFLKALYDDSRCTIGLGGRSYPGFSLEAGIRQGCPLSPLLFAVAMDILLRRLRRLCSSATSRAFADDTAMTIESLPRDGPVVAEVFEEFGEISGMHLNARKCILIPLWSTSVVDAASSLASWVPKWAGFFVQFWGKYLGFAVGPASRRHVWPTALAKFADRARSWAALGLGLHYNTAVYNTYVVSVLSFLFQLARPPPDLAQVEAAALRRLASGPGNWVQPRDLYYLKDCFGQVRSFVDPLAVSVAARLRVAAYENVASGGLKIRKRASQLRRYLAENPPLHWHGWYADAAVFVVEDAFCEFESSCRISVSNFISGLRALRGRETVEQAELRVRRTIQKELTARLLRARRPLAEDRMRERLERWRLPGLPLRVARRVLRRLEVLRRIAPPRLGAAVFSTAWNRWCTAHRLFQRREACVLGCGGPDAGDTLEHYSACRVVRKFASSFLNLNYAGVRGLEVFVLAAPELEVEGLLVRCAILAYAVWRHTETTRRSGGRANTEQFHLQALQQAAREGVRGHARARAVLDGLKPQLTLM